MLKRTYLLRTIKLLALIAAFVLIFLGLQELLRYKFVFRFEETPETEMWENFYELPEDSTDILFLGSSHVYNDVNPMLIYEESQIKGFDLSTSNQDFFASFHLLREALKTQKPRVVALESFGFFQTPFYAEDYDKSSYYKMAFDDMHISGNKLDAVMEWKKNTGDIKVMERLFPLLDYHSRWNELYPVDFESDVLRSVLLGYACSDKSAGKYDYSGYGRDNIEETSPFADSTMAYFEKIYNLCADNDIELVIFTSPEVFPNAGNYLAVERLAADLDIPYINYNYADIYESLGIDGATDWRDPSHLNMYGAPKFSRKLIADISEITGLLPSDGNEVFYADKVEKYHKLAGTLTLAKENDFEKYIETLAESDYAVFIVAKDEAFGGLSDDVKAKLQKITPGVDYSDCYGRSFYAVCENGSCIYDMNTQILEHEGALSDGSAYYLASVGFYAGAENGVSFAEVEINGQGCCINENGLNFVVYNTVTDEIVDSCMFATFSEEKMVFRLQ